MPRGKRKTPSEVISDQLAQIDSQIQKEQDKLKELQNRKEEILKTKRQQELADLYDKIQASGKSVDDIIKVLDEKQ